MLTPEAAPGVGAPTLRRTASAASALPSPAYARTADDVEDGDAEAASARSAPAQDMSAAIAALLLPVYVPRAILSTGSGLCVVARPLFARHLGLDDNQTGLVAAAVPLGRMVANLPAGLLSQGVGHSGGMAAGAMLLALGALVTAAAAGFHALLLGSVLIGGGEALFNIGTQAQVRNAVGGHMHGRTLSVLAAIPRWATIISPVLGSFLVTWVGWPAPFVALAALAATAAAVVLVAPTSGRGCAAARKAPAAAAPSGMTRSGSRAALAAGTARLRSTAAQHWRAIATGGVAVACLNALRAVRALYIPLHGANAGMTEVQVGWAVTLGFALDSLLIVPSGVLMDRRGRKLTGVPALLLLAAGVALIPSAQTPRGLAAVGILLGCGNGLSAGISGTLAADFSPPAPDTGAFLGLWRFVADGGSLVGPVAAGALSRRTNLGVAARCVGLFGVASAVWLALVVPETGKGFAAGPRDAAAAKQQPVPRRTAPGGGWAKALRRARRALAARLRAAGLGRRQESLRLLSV